MLKTAGIPQPGLTEKKRRYKAMLAKPDAEASANKEPDAEKLHVRVCEGGAGQPAFLPRQSEQ